MSFFRQGSWMILCNTLAGVMMFGVHFLAPSLRGEDGEGGEYGLFMALLGILTLMMSSSPGIQTLFTHETAAATTAVERGRMTQRALGVIKLSFALWILVACLVALFHKPIFAFYKMEQAWPLVITMVAGLLHLWLPVYMGVLQGAQKFSWLGWTLLANGGGRLGVAILLVILMGGSAQSVMLGVLAGVAMATSMAYSAARPYLGKSEQISVEWNSWLRGALPLALAPVVFQMMMSADLIFFRDLMSKSDSSYYGLAGTLGRGLVMLLGPLAGVMFPKLVRSHREGRGNSLLLSTLFGTLALGGVVFLFFLGMSLAWPTLLDTMRGMNGTGMTDSWAQKLLAKEHGLTAVMDLVPWFAAAMLFLSCSNVLLSNLLAYKRYRVLFVPFLVVVAYLVSLALIPSNGKELVQLIFLFNLLLLLVLISLVWWTGTWRVVTVLRGGRVKSNE